MDFSTFEKDSSYRFVFWAWGMIFQGLAKCRVSPLSEGPLNEALNLSASMRVLAVVTLSHTKSMTSLKPRRPLEERVGREAF